MKPSVKRDYTKYCWGNEVGIVKLFCAIYNLMEETRGFVFHSPQSCLVDK